VRCIERTGNASSPATAGGLLQMTACHDLQQALTVAADDTKSNDPAQREQEYIAALKKCDPLTGADKQKCIEAAKKKFGQM